jgi:hypothetical protein
MAQEKLLSVGVAQSCRRLHEPENKRARIEKPVLSELPVVGYAAKLTANQRCLFEASLSWWCRVGATAARQASAGWREAGLNGEISCWTTVLVGLTLMIMKKDGLHISSRQADFSK